MLMRSALISKGHEELIDNTWLLANGNSKKGRRKNAIGFSLLYSSIRHEFRPSLLGCEGSFIRALEMLARSVGENSIIVLCD